MNFCYTPDPSFRGVIAFCQNGKTLFESVTGYADLPNEIPNTIQTRFASASAGKVFVAAAILKLIEQRKLRFGSTLGELLRIDLHQIDPAVTVRELLTHTSGVPDYFDESVMDEYEELWADYPNYKIRRNNDLFPLFLEKPMMYPSGTKFQYNNSGYVLLASVIEAVTEKYFDEYLQEAVFNPCGMTETGYFELDRLPARCANNYIHCPDTNTYRTNIFSVDVKGTGAGGAFITVGDILKFWNGLLEGKILSKEMVSEMLRRQTRPDDEAYGYGVWIRDENIPSFQGCDPGVSFITEYNPHNETVAILVSNYGDNVWKELNRIRESL